MADLWGCQGPARDQFTSNLVVKSVQALFAVLSLVLCFEFKNKCNDFMLLAMRMLRYSTSRHFSRVCYTFFFVAEFFKPWRSWRKPKALSRNGLVSYDSIDSGDLHFGTFQTLVCLKFDVQLTVLKFNLNPNMAATSVLVLHPGIHCNVQNFSRCRQHSVKVVIGATHGFYCYARLNNEIHVTRRNRRNGQRFVRNRHQ